MFTSSTSSLQVSNVKDFAKHLCCNPEAKLKVVSIFGNTGDGKSHTLNYTFFQGLEVIMLPWRSIHKINVIEVFKVGIATPYVQ